MTDRVVIVGAGAIGGYFGARMAAAGRDVTFVARGANLDALRSSGIRITGAMGEVQLTDVRATDDPAAVPASDLVLLCVKSYDLEETARTFASAGQLFLTLQNGVDAPSVAAEVLGPRVLAGTTGIVADLPEPGHVHVTSAYAWIRFGELRGGGVTERVADAQRRLDVDGIEPIATDDARVALWEKMGLMCGMAGLTTLHQRPMGEVMSDSSLRDDFETIVAECEAVARALAVPLADDFRSQRVAYALRIDPAAMSSMSRDFKRGRRIELETFNGAIVRMGAELGIDVPRNRSVYDAINAKLPS